MVDDWELLAAWRAGDAGAGNALVAAHFEAVSRFFRGKLGDDVEDLLQQTFLACVEGKDRIAGVSFKSYLFGVATRRLFDHLRGRYRAGRPVSFSEISLADLGTTPSERCHSPKRRSSSSTMASARLTSPWRAPRFCATTFSRSSTSNR